MATTARFVLCMFFFPLVIQPILATSPPQGPLPPPAKKEIDFRKDIYPLLSARCFRCHKGTDASGQHRLDLRAELLGETTGKPLVKIGKSADSRLIRAVTGRIPGKQMPRRGKPLSRDEIGLLRAWIDQGLVWDNALLSATVASSHWSFRPVKRPALPKVKNQKWVRNPIDAFIAAKHEEKGLTPAPEASRRVLIRRLSLDLIGLPPTPKEIAAFVNDRSPDAYQKLINRLLESPHYGERWARHWLDVARWSESEGYESNHLRPYAWRYRDYVVRAFNSDKPFDRFITEQIAGDELTPCTDENLIATGFLAAARLSSNEEDKWRQRNDMLVDIVNATSSTFLGLTMNCAQCHNHKFDPITTRDYYRFEGFFLQGQPVNMTIRNKQLWRKFLAKRPPEYEAVYKLKWQMFEQARQRRIAEEKKKLSKKHLTALQVHPHKRTNEQERLVREADLKFQFTPKKIETAILPEDRKLYDELKKKLARMEKDMPDRPQTYGFYSPVTSPSKIRVLPVKGFYPLPYDPNELALFRPRILVGGDVHNRGPVVETGWPEVFGPVPKAEIRKHPRLALAKWLASKNNPLTARVYVNRLWQYHFGRGIVATVADFGKRGAGPTHPQLLDWLADEFMRSGWSTKHIHRLIVMSSTYRMASTAEGETANVKKANSSAVQRTPQSIDPDNHYYWRWQPRRLEAEAIRDCMLAVSGELDCTIGGKSAAADGKSLRRTLYLLHKRDHPTQVDALFDGPSACLESRSKRFVSTVPLQALYLLNNDVVLQRAKALAARVQKRAGNRRNQQIEESFSLTLGRRPDAEEMQLARRFFARDRAPSGNGNEPSQALVHFCQALLNVNEFVYVE